MLVDKPRGITSFDVIRILRQRLGVWKMGHAGTLDPNASGLLIIGLGEGTGHLKDVIGLPKTYIAEILLGVRTTTGDLDGDIIETKEVLPYMRSRIAEVLSSMTGVLKLPVPAFSAIKQNGVPLYKKARKGIPVEVPIKEMRVSLASLMDIHLPVVTVSFDVSSGTYVRSLAEEFGRRLGTVATLQNLRRTRIGEYRIEDAETLENI